MKLRAALLILSAARLCVAQFEDLVTTNDGSRLYFSSKLRLRGTDESAASKIFMIDQSGAHLIDEELSPGEGYSNSYADLYAPTVTGDGSFLAYYAKRACNFGSPCAYDEFSSPKTPPGTPNPFLHYGGGVMVSRDGHFAVNYTTVAGVPYAAFILIDLTTGVEKTLRVWVRGRPLGVGSNGSVLAATSNGPISLIAPGASDCVLSAPCPSVTSFGSNVWSATMSDSGSVIVYAQGASIGQRGIFVMNAAGKGLPIGPANTDNYQPVISGDGGTVVYLSSIKSVPQLFVIRIDGTGLRQLTSVPAGIRTATLSGDGKVVYATTQTGALLRIDTQTAATQQLAGPVPDVTKISTFYVPGGLVTLDGSRLASTTAVGSPPYPTELGGVSVSVLGQQAPLLYVSPTKLVFQIPWETPSEPPSAYVRPPLPIEIPKGTIVLAGGDPYFDAAFWSPVYTLYPQPVAVHQNGSEMVTLASPAKPGEIVTIYATGLGPVSPPIDNGVLAPIDRLSRVTGLEFCFFHSVSDCQTAKVPFAGLAPGFIGLYQINVQIPERMPDRPMNTLSSADLQAISPDLPMRPFFIASIPVIRP